MTKIHQVPTSMIADFWPECAPLLAAALDRHPFLGIDDLRGLLEAGNGTDLFVANVDGRILGAAAIEVVIYPSKRTGNVIALGGSRGFYELALPQMVDRLEKWCRDNLCSSISMLGRPGWAKFITQRGWHVLPSLAGWKELDTMPAQVAA